VTAPEFLTFEAAGLVWTAESAVADAVRRRVAEHLDDLIAAGGATVLKRNLVRTVLRVPLPRAPDGLGPLIVKRYAVRGPKDWLKYTFRVSRAAAEWRAGRALAAAGVPTAVPLAKAERRHFVLRDAALVVPEIPGALHLGEYVERHWGSGADAAPSRAALFDQLARIVRRMHDAGFVHHDLHGGNVLVSGLAAAPSIHVIDLHSVRSHAVPLRAARRFDLFKLLHSMRACSTPAERRRLLEVYAGAGPRGSAADGLLVDGAALQQLESRLRAMERKRVRSRTERSLERSSKFDVSRVDGFLVHHLRALPAGELVALVRAHRATLAEGGKDVLKRGKRSDLTRQRAALGATSRGVVVKGYKIGGWTRRLESLVRRSRPVAAWVAGNGLLLRGFAAAEPYGLVLRRVGPFSSEAYLVMEDLGEERRADLVVLHRYARTLATAEIAEKRALVLEAARFVRALHAAGVYHADLKAVNLFVRERRGTAPEIVCADYDRVVFDRPVSERRRIKNLAQLSASVAVCVSRSDRLRFLLEYAGDDVALRARWKEWFRAVADECGDKIVVRMQPIE
jgi:tRNA A-37 threonylcarbamoyl transferase component Bud32